jgi:hypothetical protein
LTIPRTDNTFELSAVSLAFRPLVIQMEQNRGRNPIEQSSQLLSVLLDLSQITLHVLAFHQISFNQTELATCLGSPAKSINTSVKAEFLTKKCEDAIGPGRIAGPKSGTEKRRDSIAKLEFKGQKAADRLTLMPLNKCLARSIPILFYKASF